MMSVDENATEDSLELYRIQGFIYFDDEESSKYDFRTKSLDTAMDLLVSISQRPAYENLMAHISLTIGDLNFSLDTRDVEAEISGAVDLTKWKFL
jgi:hypothetical protein